MTSFYGIWVVMSLIKENIIITATTTRVNRDCEKETTFERQTLDHNSPSPSSSTAMAFGYN